MTHRGVALRLNVGKQIPGRRLFRVWGIKRWPGAEATTVGQAVLSASSLASTIIQAVLWAATQWRDGPLSRGQDKP